MLVVAFGLFMPGNLWVLFHPEALAQSTGTLNAGSLRRLLGFELLMLVLLGSFLAVRGWNAERLGLKPISRDFVTALALTLVVYAVTGVIQLIAVQLAPGIFNMETQLELVSRSIDIGTIVGTSFVNGVFEEVFVCGYLITALREKRSIALAVNVSAALRLSYHLYQGAFGVIGVLPIGLLFGYVYARTGRLWPLILSHTLIDIIALSVYN